MDVGVDHAQEGGVWNEAYHWWEWRDAAGRWHRVDGPAIVRADGLREWFLHGDWHRADGPAVIRTNGHQEWRLHGKRHRVDGPAVIGDDGRQWWYVKGRDITTEVNSWMARSGITLPFTPEQRMEFELRWL